MIKDIITIDGPAGSGKSTVAKILAKKLGYSFLDTGAMYRAVALAYLQNSKQELNDKLIKDIFDKSRFEFIASNNSMKICLDGKDISEKIRSNVVTNNVKNIASLALVRDYLVQMQRDFAASAGKVVTEGRDQGTVVFPDARIKIFLNADIKERAKRRFNELKDKDQSINITQIEQSIAARDAADMTREISPLRKALDAIEIDTTGLDINAVVDKILKLVSEKR